MSHSWRRGHAAQHRALLVAGGRGAVSPHLARSLFGRANRGGLLRVVALTVLGGRGRTHRAPDREAHWSWLIDWVARVAARYPALGSGDRPYVRARPDAREQRSRVGPAGLSPRASRGAGSARAALLP